MAKNIKLHVQVHPEIRRLLGSDVAEEPYGGWSKSVDINNGKIYINYHGQ